MTESEKFKAFLDWRNENLNAFQERLAEAEIQLDAAKEKFEEKRAKIKEDDTERPSQQGAAAAAKMVVYICKINYLRAADNYEIAQSYFDPMHFHMLEKDGDE